MTSDADQPSTAPSVDERGVTITAEGRRRARQRLTDLDARWSDVKREEAHAAFLARLDAA